MCTEISPPKFLEPPGRSRRIWTQPRDSLSPLLRRGERVRERGIKKRPCQRLNVPLSMNQNKKRPSSPQPSPPFGEEREKSAMGGSWSQCASEVGGRGFP